MTVNFDDLKAKINWTDLKSATYKDDTLSNEEIKDDESVHNLEQKLKDRFNEKRAYS